MLPAVSSSSSSSASSAGGTVLSSSSAAPLTSSGAASQSDPLAAEILRRWFGSWTLMDAINAVKARTIDGETFVAFSDSFLQMKPKQFTASFANIFSDDNWGSGDVAELLLSLAEDTHKLAFDTVLHFDVIYHVLVTMPRVNLIATTARDNIPRETVTEIQRRVMTEYPRYPYYALMGGRPRIASVQAKQYIQACIPLFRDMCAVSTFMLAVELNPMISKPPTLVNEDYVAYGLAWTPAGKTIGHGYNFVSTSKYRDLRRTLAGFYKEAFVAYGGNRSIKLLPRILYPYKGLMALTTEYYSVVKTFIDEQFTKAQAGTNTPSRI